jgi:hypothetical protein
VLAPISEVLNILKHNYFVCGTGRAFDYLRRIRLGWLGNDQLVWY